MDATLVILVIALLALTVASAIVFYRLGARLTTPLRDENSTLQASLSDLRSQLATATSEAAEAKAGRAAAEGSRDELRKQVDALTEQRQAEQRAREQNLQHESKVLEALSPVQEHLRTMQAKIADMESQRAQQYGTLAARLEETQRTGSELRSATTDLVGALKANNVRGAWGEAQLRNIVEAAGLVEHVDFDTQQSVETADGRQRPDMILHMPGGKTIPIDAKVPFNAYIQATDPALTGAPDEAARRKSLMDQHVKAVRAHVDTLAAKAYWNALPGSPDFVVAFIPSESLLSSALEADPALLEYAFKKRVALASPVALWSVLKTVAFAWQQDLLTEDAKKLFDLAHELYERMRTLGERADKLGKSIGTTVQRYNDFAATLESRVLVTARKFKRIDETQLIPEPALLEDGPRTLTAAELEQSPSDSYTGRMHEDKGAEAEEDARKV